MPLTATFEEAIADAAGEQPCGLSPCEDRNNRSRQESGCSTPKQIEGKIVPANESKHDA
jgi:hypothetical protein